MKTFILNISLITLFFQSTSLYSHENFNSNTHSYPTTSPLHSEQRDLVEQQTTETRAHSQIFSRETSSDNVNFSVQNNTSSPLIDQREQHIAQENIEPSITIHSNHSNQAPLLIRVVTSEQTRTTTSPHIPDEMNHSTFNRRINLEFCMDSSQ